MNDGPLFTYRDRVAAGELRPDPAQELLAEKLQSLHRALNGYQPSAGHSAWKERFVLASRREEPPQGLYIYGGVGGGKSMLMDLFFDGAPVANKRRVHFHKFLQDVHGRFNAFRKSKDKDEGDPIPSVVEQLAEESWLLCFDEFQVSNIVDAMILGRLFEGLFARDVVVVATSNRPPHDLYKNGLQRERFIPFIDLIVEKLDILALTSTTDYRLERMLGMQVYHQPVGEEAARALDDYFNTLADGRPAASEQLEVKGRKITVDAAGGVARQSFAALCEQPLGPADYLEIAERYHTMIIDGIPRMDESNGSEARRFITLIDALYENKVNLICSADAPPNELYVLGEGAFEFERLVSRLMEMQSEVYLALPHGGDAQA
jgi:cell division protein ZapE